nr:hypothetical protein GCM10020092_091500 [Actinoplanes digitatis]
MRAVARAYGITVSNVLAAAWGVLVGRVTGSNDVVFGSTVSGRGGDLPGVDAIAGLLINTVPARVRWSGDGILADVLRGFAAAQREVVDHEQTALADVQRRIGLTELFDTLVVIENYPAASAPADGDVRIAGMNVIEAPHYPVTLMVKPGDTIDVDLTHRLDPAAAELLLEQYLRVLAAFAGDASRPVAALDLLSAAQRAEALALGVGGPAAAGTDVPAMIAAVDPARIAVRGGATELTYGRLCERAARSRPRCTPPACAAATSWRSPPGARPSFPSRCSACCAPAPRTCRSTRVIRPRGSSSCSRTPRPSACLSTTRAPARCRRTKFRPSGSGPSARVRRPRLRSVRSTQRPSCTPPARPGGPRPSSAPTPRWPIGSPGPGTPGLGEVRVAKSSMSFIDGTTELLGGLVAGATVVVADETAAADGAALARLVADSGATQLLAVPSLAAALAETAPDRVRGLRRWITSGEALDAGTVAALAAASPGATIVNSYGASENTGDVLAGEVVVGAPVTLGRAVPGVRVYLLDAALDPVAPGAVGEIYVGGVQLARGYRGQGGATAARFVADPFTPGERLYRTGDLGRWVADTVEFLGRNDDQVKVNGHRVELAEVEAALLRRLGVREAVAVARNRSSLHGYVVAAAGETIDPQALLAALREELPAYLVPSDGDRAGRRTAAAERQAGPARPAGPGRRRRGTAAHPARGAGLRPARGRARRRDRRGARRLLRRRRRQHLGHPPRQPARTGRDRALHPGRLPRTHRRRDRRHQRAGRRRAPAADGRADRRGGRRRRRGLAGAGRRHLGAVAVAAGRLLPGHLLRRREHLHRAERLRPGPPDRRARPGGGVRRAARPAPHAAG